MNRFRGDLTLRGGGTHDSLTSRSISRLPGCEAVECSQPCPIEPVDTTRIGDSFRAGTVCGFLGNGNDVGMVEFAAAVAPIELYILNAEGAIVTRYANLQWDVDDVADDGIALL